MSATLSKIAELFTGALRDPKPARRVRRNLSIGMGLEGLEGRIAPGTLLVSVTVTNQPPTVSPTVQPTTTASTMPTTQQVVA